MQVIRNEEELRAVIGQQRRRGQRVGFVPTMGNLHAGHFSLIAAARERSQFVVASVFVNPTQFGASEDLSRYPRTPDQDAHGLDESGCDLLFLPSVETMYPFGLNQGFRVGVPDLGNILEGASRPGHFDGVATVVAKLFNQVQPDVAVFGSKDYQQLLVVRRMSHDLGFPVQIVSTPIVREANGLAMSSRNQFLNTRQREQAAIIHATLKWMSDRVGTTEDTLPTIESAARQMLEQAGLVPDYAVFRIAGDLAEPGPDQRHGLVALVAARLGRVRLIDNMELLDEPA